MLPAQQADVRTPRSSVCKVLGAQRRVARSADRRFLLLLFSEAPLFPAVHSACSRGFGNGRPEVTMRGLEASSDSQMCFVWLTRPFVHFLKIELVANI